MTNESTEAVLDLCLQTQHENTKRAILNHIGQRVNDSVSVELVMRELQDVEDWIDQLKLEDTK